MKDNIKGKGIVTIKAVAPDGSILWEDVTYNLITNVGRNNFCDSIMAAQTVKHITQIGFGTSSTATNVTDTALTTPFTKNIGSYSRPTTTSILINWTLGTSEGNGLTIRELGLICADSVLFSRVVRADIAKTSAFSLVGTWEIQF